MSRIFFAYFFLFSTILFAEFGVLIHQLPKSSFLRFGAGKSRIGANALCDLMHGILSEYNFKHDSQKKCIIDQKIAKAALQEFYKTASQIPYLRN